MQNAPADPLQPWRPWVSRRFGADGSEAEAAAMRAIIEVHGRRGSPKDAEAAAHAAVAALRRRNAAAHVSAPASAAGGPPIPDGGVLSLALNEGTPHGQRVFEALSNAEGRVDGLPPSAFLGQPGFRGMYGFLTAAQASDLASMVLWTLLLVAFPVGIPLALWVRIATPILARRTSFAVEGAQIVLRYGFLTKKTERVELYWVNNVTHQQAHFHKRRGECSILITLDGGPWRGHVVCVPGIVPVGQAEAFCRRLRHAAQHVRKSPGVFYSTLPPN